MEDNRSKIYPSEGESFLKIRNLYFRIDNIHSTHTHTPSLLSWTFVFFLNLTRTATNGETRWAKNYNACNIKSINVNSSIPCSKKGEENFLSFRFIKCLFALETKKSRNEEKEKKKKGRKLVESFSTVRVLPESIYCAVRPTHIYTHVYTRIMDELFARGNDIYTYTRKQTHDVRRGTEEIL